MYISYDIEKNLKILKLIKFLRTIFQNFQSQYHEDQKNLKILKSEFRRLHFKIFRVTNIIPHDGQKKI